MSTYIPRRIAPALLVLLFLLVTGCDENPVGVTPEETSSAVLPSTESPETADTTDTSGKFVIFFSGTRSGRTFQSFGAFEDYGRVVGRALPLDPKLAPGSVSGRRTLIGRHGSLTITYVVLIDGPGSVEGRFKIIAGTGEYASLRGGGYFSARLNADGSLTEEFTGTTGPLEAADDRIAVRFDAICLAKTTAAFSGQRVTLNLRGPGGIALREYTPDRMPLVFVALDGTTPYKVFANAPGHKGDPTLEIVFKGGPVNLSGGWLLKYPAADV